MAQIKKGTTYDSGDNRLVTPTNLNNHVENAVLYKGAITEQAEIPTSESVSPSDEILISNTSNPDNIYPNKTTVEKLMASGSDVVANNVDAQSLNVAGDSNVNGPWGFEINSRAMTFGDVENWSDNLTYPLAQRASFSLAGDFIHLSNGGTIIASGTNGQRDDWTGVIQAFVNITGSIRYNTQEEYVEVYNGTEWKQVGYSPFEASGGNIVLGPSETVVPATFTTTDSGVNITITVSAGHDICMGQVIELTTSVSGYSGEYLVTEIPDQYTLKFRTGKSGLANASNASCSVRKSGLHKVHIFKNNGYFVVGDADITAEVLIVGGGGGTNADNRWTTKGGGSGGVLTKKNVIFKANTEYNCIVGTGGNTGVYQGGGWTDGNNSSIAIFGQGPTSWLYATGGKAGSSGETGASGYTSDNAHLPDDQRRRLGTTYGDWQSWSGKGCGAGAGQSVVPRDGPDNYSISATNRTLPAGIVSDITNIPIMYAPSGGDNVSVRNWHSSLDDGMYSPDSSRGFRGRGIGAAAAGGGAESTVKPTNGNPGIIIIRYPYRLR